MAATDRSAESNDPTTDPAAAPDAHTSEFPGAAPVRIVVAEDEALIRLDLRETLEEEGYVVVGEAGNGDEAVSLVRELSPDVVILDIKMPGTDGLAAARTIIDERGAAVVMLTAFSQRDLIEQARDAGALAYVVKPFHRNDLVPAIELARARFADLAREAERADELEGQLETRKLVDRAKGRLMDRHELSEQEAFRFVQTQAMTSRRTMKDVAEAVLDGSLTP